MARSQSSQGFKRILVIGPNWLGDVLFATPFLRALRSFYSSAEIFVLIPQRVEPALKKNPNIQGLFIYDERIDLGSSIRTLGLIARLKQKKFDAAFLLSDSRSKAFILKAAGIPVRVGYTSEKKNGSLTHGIPQPLKPMHKIDLFLCLADAFGIPPQGRHMDFYPDAAASASLEHLLSQKGIAPQEPYIVLHVGGNWELKRWPLDHFAQWLRLWLERFDGKAVICGTRSEEALTADLLGRVRDPRVVSVCGQTSLDELAWLLKGARLFLSNDSGPIHLAASQNTPIAALFGPTSAALTGPVSSGPLYVFQKDVGCQVPCYYRTCNDHLCMRSLTPKEVFRSVAERVA